jgi:hypothetical protein
MTTKFEEIRDKFINRQGRLAAAPVTTFLSGDSSARLVFQQALGENANLKIFRVFETDNADIKSIKGTELPVLSVQPALEKLVDGYRPNDSVLLRVEIDPQTPPLWREHHFLILACSGGQVGKGHYSRGVKALPPTTTAASHRSISGEQACGGAN